jgi:hypothetical protein
MSKQVYEAREDKTMDWEKRLRYSVNYAKQLWPLECRGKETVGPKRNNLCMIDVIHGEQSDEKIGAKQPLHVSSSHASRSEGSLFRVARNEGNLGALSALRLAPSELLLLKLPARPQPPVD